MSPEKRIHTTETHRPSNLPQRDKFPIIVNPDLADFEHLSGMEQAVFRRHEVGYLAARINSLPIKDFRETREAEIARLGKYYDAFASLFGVDLRAVGRTRMQLSGTVMESSPLLMQSMFPEQQGTQKVDQIFFESRLNAGGFQFNATSINSIEGFGMGFSVLKMTKRDRFGEFEVDFPAVSLPREPLVLLDLYNRTHFGNIPLEENPLVSAIADGFGYRVHDWFHAAILYDTKANTRIFQKWSDNSFFVEHFFKDPFMINYEFMADKIHFMVWQQIFKENEGAKAEVISNAKGLLDQLDTFERWANGKDNENAEEHKKMANFLAYVGLRGLFNIIPFDDPELLAAVGDLERFKRVVEIFPAKYKPYLRKVYENIEEQIPFRAGSDKRLSLGEVLSEYVDSLESEAQAERKDEIIYALYESSARGERIQEMLPAELNSKFAKIDIKDMDPRIFITLSESLKRIELEFGPEVRDELVSRIEVDDGGCAFLRVDKDELDLEKSAGWVEATHSKAGVLVQLPWDFKEEGLQVVLESTETLTSSHVRAVNRLKPGDIVLINSDDQVLAALLLEEGEEGGDFSFDKFWMAVQREKMRGHTTLADIYVYPTDKVDKVFDVDLGEDARGRVVLEPGYYHTKVSKRLVIGTTGPISIDGNSRQERRHILYGAVAQSNVITASGVDVFPVDARSFDKFYSGVDREDLANFRLDESKVQIPRINEAIGVILEDLDHVNSIRLAGYRGKEKPLRVGDLTS